LPNKLAEFTGGLLVLGDKFSRWHKRDVSVSSLHTG
jgi:hypothetical protein